MRKQTHGFYCNVVLLLYYNIAVSSSFVVQGVVKCYVSRERSIEFLENNSWHNRRDLICNFINHFPIPLTDDLYDSIAETDITNIYFYNSELHHVPSLAFHKFIGLRWLYMNNSMVDSVEMGSFLGLVQLKELHLENNNIKEIPPGTFNHLNALNTLDLSNNQLTTLKEDFILGMVSLKNIYLRRNRLKSLPNTSFSILPNLEDIDISSNEIETFNVTIFNNLRNLTYLNISNNKIEYLQLGLFKDLVNLKMLDLSGNAITAIPLGALSGLGELKHLNLSRNELTKLNIDSLHMLGNLSSLNLENNKLNYLEPLEMRSFLPNLTDIYLDRNRWGCASLLVVVKLFRESHLNIQSGSSFQTDNVNGIRCTKNSNLSEVLFPDRGNTGLDQTNNLQPLFQGLNGNLHEMIEKISHGNDILDKIAESTRNHTNLLRAMAMNAASILLNQETLIKGGRITSNSTDLKAYLEGSMTENILNHLENTLVNFTRNLEETSKTKMEGGVGSIKIVLEEISKNSKQLQNFLENKQNQYMQLSTAVSSGAKSPIYDKNFSDSTAILQKVLFQTESSQQLLEKYIKDISENLTFLHNKINKLDIQLTTNNNDQMPHSPEYLKSNKPESSILDLESLKTIIVCLSVVMVTIFLFLMVLYLRSARNVSLMKGFRRLWYNNHQPDRSDVNLTANSDRTIDSRI